MKKLITLAAFLLLLKTGTNAQASSCGVTFIYDAAGNRTQRKLCFNDIPIGGLVHSEKNELDAFAIISDGDNDLANWGEFLFFPNPSSGIVKIKNTESWLNSQLTVYDVDGKIKRNLMIQSDVLDFQDLVDGIYFLKVKKGQHSFVTKLSIIKN